MLNYYFLTQKGPPLDVPKCGFLGNAPACQNKHGNFNKSF